MPKRKPGRPKKKDNTTVVKTGLDINEIVDVRLSEIVSKMEDLLKAYQCSVDIEINKVNGEVNTISLKAKINL